jgi:hypothetical protein
MEIDTYVKSIFSSITLACPSETEKDRLADITINARRAFGYPPS